MGAGGEQRLCFDLSGFYLQMKMKRAVRYLSLELRRRNRTADTNMGITVKMLITGTTPRLWTGKSPVALQH